MSMTFDRKLQFKVNTSNVHTTDWSYFSGDEVECRDVKDFNARISKQI